MIPKLQTGSREMCKCWWVGKKAATWSPDCTAAMGKGDFFPFSPGSAGIQGWRKPWRALWRAPNLWINLKQYCDPLPVCNCETRSGLWAHFKLIQRLVEPSGGLPRASYTPSPQTLALLGVSVKKPTLFPGLQHDPGDCIVAFPLSLSPQSATHPFGNNCSKFSLYSGLSLYRGFALQLRVQS